MLYWPIFYCHELVIFLQNRYNIRKYFLCGTEADDSGGRGSMHKFNEELFQSVLDLNESIAFEYDIINDVMSFAPNVSKYMPCPLRVPSYLEEIEFRGKLFPEDLKRALAFFSVIDEKDFENVRMEYLRFMNFSGEYPWYQIKGKVIKNAEGVPELLFGTYTGVNGNHLLEGELEERYTKDPLTGLDNKETVLSKIEQYYEDIPEFVIPGIMLVGVDNYDIIAGRMGEQAAESVVIEMSRICRRALRAADLIGIYDKSGIVIAMKGIRDERIYCERASYIIDAVKDVWKDYDAECPPTASVGIAVSKEGESRVRSADQLLEHALEALVYAKRRGNTYVVHSGVLLTADKFLNIRISGHEMELVKSILDPVMSWAYAVDENYNLVYKNELLDRRIPGECSGICYVKLKGYSQPCQDCPLSLFRKNTTSFDSCVYSPSLRSSLNMRTTRLTMRNGMHVYVLANIKEDLAEQMDRLRVNTKAYQEAINDVCDIIWEIDLHRNLCNRIQEKSCLAVEDRGSIAYRKLIEHYLNFVVHPEDRGAFCDIAGIERLREVIKLGKDEVQKEMRLLQQDGTYRWFSICTALVPGNTIYLFGRDIHNLRRDIIARFAVEEKYNAMMKRNEYQKEIAQSNERYEHVNELTGSFVFEYNVPEAMYYVCTTFEEMFVLKKEMLLDEWSLLEGLHPYEKDQEKFSKFLQVIREEPDTHEVTVRLYNRYNRPVWFTITVQTLKGLNNILTRLIGVIQNVNTEMEIKAELEYRADYDSVTGLYNSDTFYRNAAEVIFHHPDTQYAIISVDVDHFRIINDRFGIEAGNRCLKFMGRIIQEVLGDHGIAGRYQGDIFSVLFACEQADSYMGFVKRLSERFTFQEAAQCGSALSFGIYKVVDPNIPVQLMCDRARLAKKGIKGSTLVNYAVYDDSIRLKQREESEIESEMQLALEHKEFQMYLQPKYDINTETVVGAEALVRWSHPLRGLRMPGEFLPLFENNGFIKNLDEYMWECAAAYIAKMKREGKAVPISVNISRLHVNTTDLVEVLTSLVERYKIDPSYLELEITENIFMEDVSRLYVMMRDLKAAGFVIEMDDFGSGYSSLNMLRNAPIDVIKIDRFFLDEIISTERGRIIVENTIVMSKKLGLKVVAEGVETREQVEFLRKAGCDVVQGYYYSKPVQVCEFEKLI